MAEEKMARHQEVSTAMITRGRMSGMVIENGKDERTLRRWCWMEVSTPERFTYIATGYMPCDGC